MNPHPCLANLSTESNFTRPRNLPPLQKDKLSYKFSNQNSEENQTHQSPKSVGQTQISVVDLHRECQKALKNYHGSMIKGLAKKHQAFHFLSSLSTFSLYLLNMMDSVARSCSTSSQHSLRSITRIRKGSPNMKVTLHISSNYFPKNMLRDLIQT